MVSVLAVPFRSSLARIHSSISRSAGLPAVRYSRNISSTNSRRLVRSGTTSGRGIRMILGMGSFLEGGAAEIDTRNRL
jgi:hypothetical protein